MYVLLTLLQNKKVTQCEHNLLAPKGELMIFLEYISYKSHKLN